MERVLAGLAPERVFYWFEELAKIPHGSGNTKGVSDLCVNFAKERGLFVVQDELNNVIIRKPASAGCENAPGVILQGHLDMVAEKEADSDHDFLKDPLKLVVDGDYVRAEGTTLGGDDGIAIATALAILEDDSLRHPELEAIFTTEEEVGMEGAAGIDLSCIRGRMMLNLDSEEEGVFTVGCAGGVRYDLTLPVRRLYAEGKVLSLLVDGLTGGHSGTEINKGRANANILMGRLLYALEEIPYALVSLEGGSKDNAIPRRCEARIVVDPENAAEAARIALRVQEESRKIYSAGDPELRVTAEETEETEAMALNRLDQEKAVFLLNQCPNGVQAMSMDIPGLVETSLNLGVLKLEKDHLQVRFSLRSAKTASKEQLERRLEYLIAFLGGDYTYSGDYPAWEYRKESRLRDLCVEVWKEMNGTEPVVETIHAGLECGILGDKLPGLDCVSMGPEMHDIHTPRERLGISSAARMYAYLLRVLERLC